jgi:Uma2 family endonuclease
MTIKPKQPSPTWSLAQLRRHFGMIPAERIVLDPPPGTATEEDLIGRDKRGGPTCELVDGVLVEKAMGYEESELALELAFFIKLYLRTRKLGIVLGEAGFLRLFPGVVRAPDISFISWERVPSNELPDEAIAPFAPDLAVEVISESNTRAEMARKLREYFEGGARLVWFVYPKTRTVAVYTSVTKVRRLRHTQTLEGGDVLPGFELPLAQLFAPRRKPRGR